MSARGAQALFVVLLLGCESSVTVQRAWPQLDDAKSAVLVAQRADPPLGPLVLALDIEDPALLIHELPAESAVAPVELTLILYDLELSALGLVAGQVALARPGIRSRPIPSGGRIYRGGTSPEATEWSEEPALGASVDAIRIEDQRRNELICPPFSLTLVDLGDREIVGEPRFGIALDDERALVVTGIGRAFVATTTKATELTVIPGSPPISGGYRSPDGELWLMTQPGDLYRGRIGSGFTKVATTPDAESDYWTLAGPSTDAPFELYALGSLRSVYRFDGSTFEQLLPPTRFDLDQDGAVMWLRPGVANVVGPALRSLTRYDLGSVSEESVPLFGDDELRTGGLFPRYGRIVTTARGYVFQSIDEEAWLPLGEENIGIAVRAVTPWGDRLFFAAAEGLMTTFVPDFGYCEPHATGIGRVNRAFGVGERILALPSSSSATVPSRVVFVSR